MISLIVAYDKNRCIGNNNTIPWKMKSDMLRVKNLTTNQTILMGRKTFESIGKALPNRINRVLTRSTNYSKDNIEVYSDKNKAIEKLTTEKIFIFGGSIIYKEYIDRVEEMYITEIDAEVSGDSYFPAINLEEWELIEEESFAKDEDNEYNYKFLHYKRLEVK
ncbi:MULTISPECIES: dihydrofolate reductase [unclassified Gemella]|uniref:dihydrofolate reductase n=1 Tax=unclassified Gemella TaxID=2624949 RepID=UPI001C046D2E|nr:MULTISPECIES: dihydrofolate reductase [unclassified Gemella]MBU0278130.1 dihydrofolate reductase [Gemella sp. zg-1178]QWQ38345.1 dihydrofolate reductase [Gemella sp. zg-570]